MHQDAQVARVLAVVGVRRATSQALHVVPEIAGQTIKNVDNVLVIAATTAKQVVVTA